MNESKIRLLADEASEWCKKNAHGAPAEWEWEYKFAELIVRECLEQFALGDTNIREIIQDRFAQCRKVAKHFGVK